MTLTGGDDVYPDREEATRWRLLRSSSWKVSTRPGPSWWSRWDAAEKLYFTTIRPPGSFELVVEGY